MHAADTRAPAKTRVFPTCRGRRDQARELLTRAASQDATKVRNWLASDPMFEVLKGDPDYERIARA